MYDEFKIRDIELLKIAQNARNYGLEFGENLAVLELFFHPKNFDITSSDLQNIGLVFTSLESIKEKFQLSK